VELICQYQHDGADDDTNSPTIAQELLRFSIPLHFVIPTAPFVHNHSVSSTSLSLNPTPHQQNPYDKHTSMKIPAYSQLFYSNGDPRFNEWDTHGEALPAYCKDEGGKNLNECITSNDTLAA